MGKHDSWSSNSVEHNKPTPWGWVVGHPYGLKIGRFVDIGFGSYLQSQYGIEIQDHVKIGAHCSIYSRDDITPRTGKVVLEQGCSIGANTVVLPGVTIGEGSVVGAMSLVTKNIPKGVLAHGVPAKVVRVL